MEEKKKTHLDIDHSTLIGKTYDMFADQRESGFYWHPSNSEWKLKLYSPDKIVPVTVEIIKTFTEEEWKNEKSKGGEKYYGHYECYDIYGEDIKENVSMIWPAKFQFDMCFPAGAMANQKREPEYDKEGTAWPCAVSKSTYNEFREYIEGSKELIYYGLEEAAELGIEKINDSETS